MTVKTTVSFTDHHHSFAQAKVQEGHFASVSSLVAAGIERLMQDEQEREIALEAMKEAIQHRMQTPREAWIEMDAADDVFDRARARLARRSSK